MTDIVDHLGGFTPGSPVATLRERRPVTREQTQASYDALFEPFTASEVTRAERALVAAFVTRLAGDSSVARHYAALAEAADLPAARVIADEASRAATSGPYGSYKEVGLRAENRVGRVYAVEGNRAALGERLAVALEHAHLLVFRPRDASADALDALLAAGWSADGIVTLSQLVSFLSYQQRVVLGLRVLAEELSA